MTTPVTDKADRGLLEQVVQVAAGPVLSQDPDGRTTSWNASAERLQGVPARTSVGRLVTDAPSAETATDLEDAHRTLQTHPEAQQRSTRDLKHGLARLPRS